MAQRLKVWFEDGGDLELDPGEEHLDDVIGRIRQGGASAWLTNEKDGSVLRVSAITRMQVVGAPDDEPTAAEIFEKQEREEGDEQVAEAARLP